MEKVPQIVRERLRVATPVGTHPDADVLTAFAERSLPEQERTIVLEHVARCGECREVVALALPEAAPVAVQVAGARSRWLSWPVLRWGFAMAGVVVIASLGVVQYRRQAAPKMAQKVVSTYVAQAKNEGVAPQGDAAVKEPAPAATEPATTATNKEQDKAQVAVMLRTDAKKAVTNLKTAGRDEAPVSQPGPTVGGAIRGSLAHGPRMANQNQLNQWQTQNNAFVATAPAAAAPPVPPAQGQLVADSRVPSRSQAGPVQVEASAPAIEANKLDLQNQPLSKQAANDGYAESKVEKTKSAETLVTVGPTKVLANSENRSFDYLSASPRWAITSYGTLQRSYDQGASWQDVPVKGTSGGAAAGIMAARETTPAKAAGLARAKDAKQKAASEAPTVFRAVAAFGNEVWAGGSAGQLYHSSDAGSHWLQVVPSSGNITLAGDIVSLDFSDAQHGRVTTSTPEVWLTSDAGQTWQKQ